MFGLKRRPAPTDPPRSTHQPALKLRMGGRTRRTLDWTLSGLSVRGSPGEFRRGEQLDAKLKVPGGPRGAAMLEVTAVRSDSRVHLRFLQIATDCFLALAAHPAGRRAADGVR